MSATRVEGTPFNRLSGSSNQHFDLATLLETSGLDRTGPSGQRTSPGPQLSAGWWLLPSMVFGTALWVWMINLTLGLFQVQSGLQPLTGA
jgi:hypothetical protein